MMAEEMVSKSQGRHIMERLLRHRLGMTCGAIIVLLYIVVAFAPFIAPNDFMKHNPDRVLSPPTKIRFVHEGKFHLRPFVYAMDRTRDPVTFERIYTEDRSEI